LSVHGPTDWPLAHTPAAATQATISKAAAPALKHVCTSISATLTTVGTLQGPIQLNLRDGATGAGTILWSLSIQLPVNGAWSIFLSGLSIPGSINTAMTLEFSAAGVAASQESVALTGYDSA